MSISDVMAMSSSMEDGKVNVPHTRGCKPGSEVAVATARLGNGESGRGSDSPGGTEGWGRELFLASEGPTLMEGGRVGDLGKCEGFRGGGGGGKWGEVFTWGLSCGGGELLGGEASCGDLGP